MSGSLSEYVMVFPTTAFNNIEKNSNNNTALAVGREVCVNNGLVNRKKDTDRNREVIQHKRHECCVPVFDPARLSNEQQAFMGETAFRESMRGIMKRREMREKLYCSLILPACVSKLLQLLSCQAAFC